MHVYPFTRYSIHSWRGSRRRYKRPQPKSYLLKEPYRRIGLPEIYALGDEAAYEYLMKARWGDLDDEV